MKNIPQFQKDDKLLIPEYWHEKMANHRIHETYVCMPKGKKYI